MIVNNDKKIEFQISELKILSFFENSTHKLKLTKKQVEKGDVYTNSNIAIYEKEKFIDFTIEGIFSIKKGGKRIELFGAKTFNSFFIKNFKETVIKDKHGKFVKSNSLFIPLIDCSLSALRGILVALPKDSYYQDIILPHLDSTKFI